MDPVARAAELRSAAGLPLPPLLRRRRPEVGDDEYDALLDELRRLEAAAPGARGEDSPTQRVSGHAVDSLKKVDHPLAMLSLANARTAEELRAWVSRMRAHLAREGIENAQFRYVCEPKIDGLADEPDLWRGELVRGVTRGDGRVGEDVTHNVRTIQGIPHQLSGDDVPAMLEVRGEVYMGIDDFTALNERRAAAGESTYMNPRNTAAGTIRQLDARQAAERPLRFWAYQSASGARTAASP